MNYNDLLSNEEMTGSLISLKDGRKVTVESIKFDDCSLQRIINAVCRNGDLKREDQDINILEIYIMPSDLETFMEGQTLVERRGNTFAFTTQYVSPVKFKCDFEAGYVDSTNNGDLNVCKVELGSISFDMHDRKAVYYDDVVCFQNITATIYKMSNHYKITKIECDL